MRIEAKNVQAFTIYDAPALDPVTVICQDFGTGKGRIIVECYGRAWSCYWGAIAECHRNVAAFVANCSTDYVVDKLAVNTGKRISKSDERYLTRIVEAVQAAIKQGVPA